MIIFRRRIVWSLLLVALLPSAGVSATTVTVGAMAQATAANAVAIDARPFPREFTVDGVTFQIHQPQLDQWSQDQLTAHAVMSVKTGVHSGADGKSQDSQDYGVLDVSARTQVDKDARAVVLTDLKVKAANFPTATAQQAKYLALAQKQLQGKRSLTIGLDQLESALAIAAADRKSTTLSVRNDPPEILFATTPAVLVLVDGQPALKPTSASGVQRVINSRSLLLQQGGKFYTRLGGRWASAPALNGPWTAASATPALEAAAKQAVDAKQVDTLDTPPAELKDALAAGKWPDIFVRTQPAELISVQGDPQFAAIPGTQLSYVSNTGADVFIDAAADHRWYVLVSGRWFSAAGSKGPWAYVTPDRLPADFAKIPPDSPKSGVLASIPGTPEAREALIANDIPQMATVSKTQAKLNVVYDGAPQFVPITGTSLQYARNTPVPVIRVSGNGYYAVDKGVWFTASAAQGPWTVATSIPAEIYTIPSNSPLHYVTYVRVYGGSNDDVYVGYTPGYYGTVVTTNNVVVYGTGYACTPWIGAYWYGCPLTYGMGVYFGWNAWVGWTFGWGWGWYDGWYGPYSPWWGPWYGPAYPYGWWGGGAAAWNVYGHWGNAAVRGTAAAWADPWTGNYGRGARGGFYNEVTGARGVGRAGVNTNIYTGTTTAGAQGIRYNPQTGRVVAGGGAAAVNPYTGQAARAGERTVVNTNTGRVTQAAGGAAVGPHGAAGAGGFNTQGPQGGDAKGAGGFHYNADTGTLHHSGVVDVNDNIYAGHDGNVYHFDNGQWNQVTRPDTSNNLSGQTRQNLDRDRFARERGNERISGHEPTQVNFPRSGGGAQRPVGGFRPALGGGGGFRGGGGGFRRR